MIHIRVDDENENSKRKSEPMSPTEALLAMLSFAWVVYCIVTIGA